MRGLCLIAAFMLSSLTSFALAHPGKTDLRGGHTCRKDCSGWDLYIGEYHLHEADYQPVRIAKPLQSKAGQPPIDDTPPAGPVVGPQSAPVGNAAQTNEALPVPPNVIRSIPGDQPVVQPDFAPCAYRQQLLVFGILLLLFALVVIRRRTTNR